MENKDHYTIICEIKPNLFSFRDILIYNSNIILIKIVKLDGRRRKYGLFR
jgi:hypothetical protein